MSTVKDFLFKYKIIIGVVVFLLLSFGIYMFVSAESDEYENQIEVINPSVTIKDGTAPFDSDNNPGNDNGESNGIVRNFDAITYAIKGKLAYKQSSTLPEDKKTSGIQRSIVIDVLLPESVKAQEYLPRQRQKKRCQAKTDLPFQGHPAPHAPILLLCDILPRIFRLIRPVRRQSESSINFLFRPILAHFRASAQYHP